jgi:hypothetical protein
MRTKKVTRIVTVDELVEILASSRTQPAVIVTRTPARMVKRDNPLAARGVQKISVRHGFLGADYASCVDRQRDREQRPVNDNGAIELFAPLSIWNGAGEQLPGNRHLVRHKSTGALYLKWFPLREQSVVYQDSRNRTIPADQVRPYLVKSSPSKRQQLSRPVKWQLIALDHLEIVKANGWSYLVKRPADEKRMAADAAYQAKRAAHEKDRRRKAA